MASRMLERRPKQPTGRLLMTLNEAIADGFSYVRRSITGTSVCRGDCTIIAERIHS
jgi:hypothetical protein